MTSAPVTGTFRRPAGPYAGLLNRFLGALPAMAPIRYSRTEFAEVRPHRLLALGCLLLVFGVNIAAGFLAPAAQLSPVTAAAGLDIGSWIVMGVVTAVWIVLVIALFRAGPQRVMARLYQAALFEEQWFRAGAEGWSWPRRVASCIVFGLAHLANLIYTIATLGLLAVMGAACMGVYLAELRRSGDRRRATITAARLHGHYNLMAIGILMIIVPAYWVLTLVDVLATMNAA